MILLHENLDVEANAISETLKEVYGFEIKRIKRNLDNLFFPISKIDFNGFRNTVQIRGLREFTEKAVLILTNRDFYCNENDPKEDWVFGFTYQPHEHIAVVSNSRMKRQDSQPCQNLEVDFAIYIKRLIYLSIHEIGHNVVNAHHYQEAKWVNTRKNYESDGLGAHCTDPSCVMYEIVDIKAPSREEGYMQLGNEKRYDAGLDDVLERMYPKWFCNKCFNAIRIDDKYK